MARSARRGSSSNRRNNTVTVNFEGVETGGGTPPPEGDYLLEVKEVTKETSSNSGEDYLAFVYKVAEGRHEGKTVYDNCSLQPQALWRLRGVLEALGEEVPDSEMDIDLDDLAGKQMMGTIEHEEYRNKPKARLTDMWPVDEEKGEKEEEEEDRPSRRRARDEEEDEEKPSRSRSRAREEEEKKPSRSKSKGEVSDDDKYTEEEIREMKESTLQKVIDQHELDVNLDDFATLRRKQAAVIDALEDADLMRE